MKPLTLPTVFSIITWANDNAIVNDVMFLRGNRSTPYIKARNGLFHYFKLVGRQYELQMTSIHDLESF